MLEGSLPHRRYNPLLDEWVLVSPHRANRPWQGSMESTHAPVPSFDPNCYLCPGNQRSSGDTNPQFESTFVFANDFPAMLDKSNIEIDHGLLQARPVTGECRVICYHPDHSRRLSTLNAGEIIKIVQTWCGLDAELSQTYEWVQIFENNGEMMGASSPHPHGQVWAMSAVPTIASRESRCQLAYANATGGHLLGDYLFQELQARLRIVSENETWCVLVPFWATWPFETLLLPKQHVLNLRNLSAAQQEGLADILAQFLPRYDALFDCPFPYSMGWHGSASSQTSDHTWLHAHFYPPLLRSATVRKFMVGFELLAETQRDIMPEDAAKRLRGES